jgi:hypothetical protein
MCNMYGDMNTKIWRESSSSSATLWTSANVILLYWQLRWKIWHYNLYLVLQLW